MSLFEKTCFFTGHRIISPQEKNNIERALRMEILNAVNNGIDVFISGGAIGFDTMAAEQVIVMRQDYDITLKLYLPCKDHFLNWGEGDRLKFHRISAAADSIFYVSGQPYREGCMKKRNKAMTEASDMCIAYMKNPRSGTAQTVKMAINKGIEVVNIAEIL